MNTMPRSTPSPTPGQDEPAVARTPRTDGAAPAWPGVDTETPDGTEMARLRVRVIALENLVISLLAEGSGGLLDRARAMAAYISPRPGSTRHRATTHAARQMLHLAQRARQFRLGARA